jgi:small-conductance mechanosensitive channel
MATETEAGTGTVARVTSGNLQAGVVGGLAGAGAFGVALTFLAPGVFYVAIPSLYGLAPPPSGPLGWIIHLLHGAVLGAVFAVFVGYAGLGGAPAQRLAFAGIVYGTVLWILLAGLVMPVWLGAVGSPANPPLPNLDTTSLGGHLLYGVVLGGVYYALENI